MMKYKKIIYTDVDFVLHNYLESFLNVVERRYGHRTPIDNLEKMLETHSKMKYALEYHFNTLGILEHEKDIILEADKEDFVPTSFAPGLIKYLKEEINEGTFVAAVTARSDRFIAQKILYQAFGINDIPIITVETQHKHYFIQSSNDDCQSFYIDDADEPANNFAKANNKNKVYVPSWPWNAGNVERLPNIERLGHDELIERIEKRTLFNASE